MNKESYGRTHRSGACRKVAAESHYDNAAYMQRMQQAMGRREEKIQNRDRGAQNATNVEFTALAEVPSGAGVSLVGEEDVRVFAETQPSEPSGSVVQLTEAPLLCGAIRGDGRRCIVGGADHDLYEVNIGSQSRLDACGTRRLSGHAEWVTAVEYFPDDRCASAGMDGRLCVWGPGKSARPQTFQVF